MLATEEAKRYEEDAREERTVTDTDNAAALFWRPGPTVTYIKTNDVIDAATDKQKCLNGFLRRKIVPQMFCRAQTLIKFQMSSKN